MLLECLLANGTIRIYVMISFFQEATSKNISKIERKSDGIQLKIFQDILIRKCHLH